MSDKVLIIDRVVTNRIVLKVKLSAAFYKVLQADSEWQGVRMTVEHSPQIVLVAAGPANPSAGDLIAELATLPGHEQRTIVALSEQNDPKARLALLAAGASDVLAKPVCEPLLLARLRSLVRHRHERNDLALKSEAADALGFSETPSPFTTRGRIGAIDQRSPHHPSALRELAARTSHDVSFCAFDAAGDLAGLSAPPDVMLVNMEPAPDNAGLAQLAELRLAAPTRQARLVAVLEDYNSPRAGMALDLGADDIVDIQSLPEELDLRISAQLRRKHADDILRNRVQNGLEAAIKDPLTGLYNRRYALSALGKLAARAGCDGNSFAVMVADLDHFKSINDTYGHKVGDIVLSRIAAQFRFAIKEQGTVARLGGEEFLILLPGAEKKAAEDTADRLRRMVRDARVFVPGCNDPLRITVSIGVTVSPVQLGQNAGAQSVEALLHQADKALYDAKSGGRDTVTFRRLSAA